MVMEIEMNFIILLWIDRYFVVDWIVIWCIKIWLVVLCDMTEMFYVDYGAMWGWVFHAYVILYIECCACFSWKWFCVKSLVLIGYWMYLCVYGMELNMLNLLNLVYSLEMLDSTFILIYYAYTRNMVKWYVMMQFWYSSCYVSIHNK